MKRIKYLALTVFLSAMLSACAPEPSNYEVRNELKIIRLNNISELSLEDGFIAGFGDSADDKGTFPSDDIGYVIEITLRPDSNIPQSCIDVLQNDKFPKQIVAYGKYNTQENGGDNYIRQIILSDVVECGYGKNLPRKHNRKKKVRGDGKKS